MIRFAAMDIEPPESTGEIRAAHRLDEARLAAWLHANVAGFGPALIVRQFEGGQSNPTFWVSDGAMQAVLRKKPPGTLLPSAHAVEREFRVISALRDSAVPVPRVYAACDDPAIIGTPFYVMEYVAGRILWDVRLPGLQPAERAAIYDETVRVLAALHSVDPNAVGLSGYGKPERYFARQVERWTAQYRASEVQPVPEMDALVAWLPEHVPATEEIAITHGDYRLDNIVFAPSSPRARAVIDWELSTLGHPLADLAYTCMLYEITMPRVGGLQGVDFATSGIPTEQALIDRYCALTGRSGVADWPVWKAFSLFRLASIVQGVYKRSLQGNASSAQAGMYGQAVTLFSGVACRLVGIGHRV